MSNVYDATDMFNMRRIGVELERAGAFTKTRVLQPSDVSRMLQAQRELEAACEFEFSADDLEFTARMDRV